MTWVLPAVHMGSPQRTPHVHVGTSEANPYVSGQCLETEFSFQPP